jgi:hypothetical protein
MDGNCPVTFFATGRLEPGNRRWGCIHRGRLYLFASAQALEQFKATPDVFSPMLAGCDPVIYTTKGLLVDGRLDHRAVHSAGGQPLLFLFASSDSRAAFAANPQPFIDSVRTAMRYADAPTLLR